VITSFLGDLVMSLSLLGLWYHALAGIRHLIWDNAIGLELETAEKLGYACIIGSVVLTVLTLIAI
jgi:succinate dehydrogenase / fumarate reductase cytochrome b subunit